MPQSKRLDISHVGGEVFTSMDDPSDRATLWGEMFKEKERQFLRQALVTETVCFSIKSTFQINVRCLWQKEAQLNRPGSHTRQGKFVTLLHGYDHPLTSSWTWIKLAPALYKKGFSVILMDLPGFGSSKMNMDPAVRLEEWVHEDWHIICQALDDLRVSASHMVALGSTCQAILKIMQRSPHSLKRETIFLEPKVNVDECFADIAGAPPPGAGKNWKTIMRKKHRECLEKLLKSTKLRIWCFTDKARMNQEIFDFQSLLADSASHPVLRLRVCIQDLDKTDLCRCRMGAELNVSFIFLAKQLVTSIVHFFETREEGLESKHHMPKYTSCDPLLGLSVWPMKEKKEGDDEESEAMDLRKWGFALGSTTALEGGRKGSFASMTPSEVERESRDEPLKAIMKKTRPKTTLPQATEKKSLELDPQLPRAQTATLQMARQRAGAAVTDVDWMPSSQSRNMVRKLHGREQVNMLHASQIAEKLTGGSDLSSSFRRALLMKLNRTQRDFVDSHQTVIVADETEDALSKKASASFKGISSQKMKQVLGRMRARNLKAVGDEEKGEGEENGRPASASRASSPPGTNSRSVTALTGPGSRSASTLPVADEEQLGLPPPPSSGSGNMRSKSNISFAPPETAGQSTRSKSNLSGEPEPKPASAMRSRSNISGEPEPKPASALRSRSNLSSGGGRRVQMSAEEEMEPLEDEDLQPALPQSASSRRSKSNLSGEPEPKPASAMRSRSNLSGEPEPKPASALRSRSNISSGDKPRSRSHLSVDIKEQADVETLEVDG